MAARWSQMLSFIWSMRDGHLHAMSTRDRPHHRPRAHCRVGGRRDRCDRGGRGGLCSVALLAVDGLGLTWSSLNVVNRSLNVGVGRYRRSMHIGRILVGVDG